MLDNPRIQTRRPSGCGALISGRAFALARSLQRRPCWLPTPGAYVWIRTHRNLVPNSWHKFVCRFVRPCFHQIVQRARKRVSKKLLLALVCRSRTPCRAALPLGYRARAGAAWHALPSTRHILPAHILLGRHVRLQARTGATMCPRALVWRQLQPELPPPVGLAAPLPRAGVHTTRQGVPSIAQAGLWGAAPLRRATQPHVPLV